MKSFLKFLGILFAIVLLSSLLAPWLFSFLPFKFERIFNRLVMIFTLSAVLVFVRIRREALVSYGLGWSRESPGLFLGCFFAMVLVLSLLVGLRLVFGAARWSVQDLSGGEWAWQILRALGAALLVAVIEEFFFRGFLFYNLYRRLAWKLWPSLAVTNLGYALIHFVGDQTPFIGPAPALRDSLRLWLAPFSALANWTSYWPEAAGLFLFGLVLNGLLLASGSLYAAIGLHAGAVFFIKADGLFVDFINTGSLLFGTQQMADGVLGWIFILVAGWLLAGRLKGKTSG